MTSAIILDSLENSTHLGYLHATLRNERLECACWIKSCGYAKVQQCCHVSYYLADIVKKRIFPPLLKHAYLIKLGKYTHAPGLKV
jgi:hypothetical protein